MPRLIEQRDVDICGRHETSKSVMRTLLEDPHEFEWDNGKTDCDFEDDKDIPLSCERQLGAVNDEAKSSNCLIDQWKVIRPLTFKYSFAIKELRTSQPKGQRQVAQQEISTMRDLRHPHVVKLLGTYSVRSRLCIMIYPAASCDLADFMTHASKHIVEGYHRSETPMLSKLKPKEKITFEYHWPLRAELSAMLEALESYYPCLCQALAYLHNSHVRHKDIKPENILIDFSGSIVLADFGNSKKFDENVKSATRVDRCFTDRYKSPEIDKDEERDYPSDIFSLGCVFLEMATLILKKPWDHCKRHCSHTVNEDGVIYDFCSNLEKAQDWIEVLTIDVQKQTDKNAEFKHCMQQALEIIAQMLSEKPEDRPKASSDLAKAFYFHGQSECPDCHPNHAWKPTPAQQLETAKATNRRDSSSLPAIIERNEHSLPRNDNKVGGVSLSSQTRRGASPHSSLLSRRSSRRMDGRRSGTSSQVQSSSHHVRFSSEPPSPESDVFSEADDGQGLTHSSNLSSERLGATPASKSPTSDEEVKNEPKTLEPPSGTAHQPSRHSMPSFPDVQSFSSSEEEVWRPTRQDSSKAEIVNQADPDRAITRPRSFHRPKSFHSISDTQRAASPRSATPELRITRYDSINARTDPVAVHDFSPTSAGPLNEANEPAQSHAVEMISTGPRADEAESNQAPRSSDETDSPIASQPLPTTNDPTYDRISKESADSKPAYTAKHSIGKVKQKVTRKAKSSKELQSPQASRESLSVSAPPSNAGTPARLSLSATRDDTEEKEVARLRPSSASAPALKHHKETAAMGLKDVTDSIHRYHFQDNSPVLICDMKDSKLKENEFYTLQGELLGVYSNCHPRFRWTLTVFIQRGLIGRMNYQARETTMIFTTTRCTLQASTLGS